MALLRIKAGKVEIIAESTAKAFALPTELGEVPGGLYPMLSSAWTMDEYRMLNGWPVPIPRYDIRSDTLVTGDGSILSYRETPTSVLTAANYRWVADTNYYNQIACRWSPLQGAEPAWEGDPAHLPSLITNYEYQIGEERFINKTALNFDSDTADYLTANLSRTISTILGYSVVMVMSPNSVFGNDVTVPFNGLWSNPPSDGVVTMDVTTREGAMWVELSDKPNQRGLSTAKATQISAPSYLAMVFNRPQVTLYLGQGPSTILVKMLDVGKSDLEMSTMINLGRYSKDLTHNADMALFDLGIYANPLTAEQVTHEFAELSKVYGGQ